MLPEHGYRKENCMKKVEEESVFVVKTLKLTDEEGAQNIIQRKEMSVNASERNHGADRSRHRKQSAPPDAQTSVTITHDHGKFFRLK